MEKKERTCSNCLWWGGDKEDNTAFCDEKEMDTTGGYFCPKWHERPVVSDQMTEGQVQTLRKLEENGCTDSDIEDFCEENLVSKRAAFHQLAVWRAPGQCRGCGNVDMYAGMPPCSSCARAYTKDHYSPESPETRDPLGAERKKKFVDREWIYKQINNYPGMESAMWAKLLRLWDAENFSDEDMKKLLPYVEPDLDAVRTKAFQEAYDYVKKEDADALERIEFLIQRLESVKKEAYELGYDNAMSALQNKRD